MPTLKSETTPLNLRFNGLADEFDRADGPIGTDWVDAHDYFPHLFDKAVILDGCLDTTGSAPSTYNIDLPGAYQYWIVGHTLVARIIPWPNFQVTMRFSTDDPLAALSQISPAIFVDFDTGSTLDLGIKPVADVSLGQATYWQNVFRTATEIGDVMDPDSYYRIIPNTFMAGSVFGPVGTGTTQEITIRVKGDWMRFWWNGNSRGGPVAIPGYVRDGRPLRAGIDVISIHSVPGHEWGTTGVTPDHVVRDKIVYWNCQPFYGTL